MSIVQISKIQLRRGSMDADRTGLPVLSPGELGYSTNRNRLFVGNVGATTALDNTEVLTQSSVGTTLQYSNATGKVDVSPSDTVTQIVAGTNVSISSTYPSGRGAVTINAVGSLSSVGILSSDLSVINSPLTANGSMTLVLNTVGINKGGTGATTKTAAFNALSPATTAGDLIYFDGANNVRLGIGTNGQTLIVSGGTPTWGAPTSGTVISVAASGGTTGLTFSGSPITSTGTLTLGGTLSIASGGTGATTAAAALTALGAYPASNPSGYTNNTGTVTSVAITGGATGLSFTGSPITSSGTLTLGGTLATSNGGTGLSTFTTNQIFYASSTSAIGQSANLTFNGTTLTANSAAVSAGNLSFSGTAQRITGDMSNATASSRLAFQSSTTNGNSVFYVLPNGTSTTSGVILSTNSDPTNASIGFLQALSTEVRLLSSINGTGTYLPMTFYTGGSERFRVANTGAFGLSGTNYGTDGQVLTSAGANSTPTWTTPSGTPDFILQAYGVI